LSESDNDPNGGEGGGQRDRERELHRAQLDAVRAAFEARGQAPPPSEPPTRTDRDDADRTQYLIARFAADLRRLDRRQRITARVAAGLALALVLGLGAFVEWVLPRLEDSHVLDEISARSIRADRVAVTGDLRLLDAAGNELAVLGREFAEVEGVARRGPVVLTLNAEGNPSRQLLRFAASNAGAGLTLEAPTGDSSLSLLSTEAGASVELRHGEETQQLAGETRLPPVGAAAPGTASAPGAAAPVLAWAPPRGDNPRGDVRELREVGHGFLVADLSAHPAADGVELRGRMVNTTAVVHNGLAFRVSLGGASATVTVPKISPGNSTGFRVALPGAASDRLDEVRVEYLGSTVAFQASSTEPIYGRRVEPR